MSGKLLIALSLFTTFVILMSCEPQAAKKTDLGPDHPFGPSTRISFDLPDSATVLLTIYSVQGQLIDTLVSGWLPAGSHNLSLNPEKMQESGVYFYKLKAGRQEYTKKMVYLR